MDSVNRWLQIPVFKRIELEQQYDRRQLPRAYSKCFLTQHPCPSWSIVAFALWKREELGALEMVQKLYLKGEPCVHIYSCRENGSLLDTLFHHFDTSVIAV